MCRLYRDLVSSGIQDYLLKPFSARISCVKRFAHAQLTLSGPLRRSDVATPSGRT